eukprot:TRINITY_DN95739_c0_g1_i1.p1 TRINITY_DN95739_c0_g1~~TRINITY_DN95739_c0_g1_i1.p1  ORF type:complete len:206 (+),score=6.19 TRINITY_DN95739_c0_g1_i1:163-780(+)
MSLLLPAAVNHVCCARSAENDRGNRDWLVCLSELALLGKLVRWTSFLCRAAFLRSFEGTAEGFLARRNIDQIYYMQELGYNRHQITKAVSESLRQWPRDALTRRLTLDRLRLVAFMFVQSKLMAHTWWLDIFLLKFARKETSLMSTMRAVTLGMVALSWVKRDLSRIGVSDTQVLQTIFNCASLVCSLAHGADTVQAWSFAKYGA